MSCASVLVVEDDPDMGELIAELFALDGFETQVALTGAEAVRAAKDSSPDLVILDLMLPDLDGLSVCREVRAQANGECGILMVTAKPGHEDRAHAFAAGVDGYMTKPFDPDRLVREAKIVLAGLDTRDKNQPRRLAHFDFNNVSDHRHQVEAFGGDLAVATPIPPAGIRALAVTLAELGQNIIERIPDHRPLLTASIFSDRIEFRFDLASDISRSRRELIADLLERPPSAGHHSFADRLGSPGQLFVEPSYFLVINQLS